MDMTGAMPVAARYEIVDANGRLLATVQAQVDGGTVSADLPTFAPGTFGRIHLVTTGQDGSEFRQEAELEELPTGPVMVVVEMG